MTWARGLAGLALLLPVLHASAATAQLPGGGGPLGEEEHTERGNEPSTLTPDVEAWAPEAGHKLPRNGVVFLESRSPLSAEWATEKGVEPAVLQRLVPGCLACVYAVELPAIDAGDAVIREVTLRVVGPRQEITLTWPVEEEEDLTPPTLFGAPDLEVSRVIVRDSFGFLLTASATLTARVRPPRIDDDVAAFVLHHPANARPLGAALNVGGCNPCSVTVLDAPVDEEGICVIPSAFDHAGNRGFVVTPMAIDDGCVAVEEVPLWAFPSCASSGPALTTWGLALVGLAALRLARRRRPLAPGPSPHGAR